MLIGQASPAQEHTIWHSGANACTHKEWRGMSDGDSVLMGRKEKVEVPGKDCCQ